MSAPPGNFGDLSQLDAASQPDAADASPGFEFDVVSPKATFSFDHIQPSQPAYVSVDDGFRGHYMNSFPGQSIIITYRILSVDGVIITGTSTIQCNSTRADTIFYIPLTEGFLVGLCVVGGITPLKRGQTWVDFGLSRGGLAGAFTNVPLVQQYLQSAHDPGWPLSPLESSSDGPGFITSYVVASPAAGADWSLTVPTNTRWAVRSVAFDLTTAAGGPNRNVALALQDSSGNNLYRTVTSVPQAGGNGFSYYVAPGLTPNSVALLFNALQLPHEQWLTAGGTIKSLTQFIQPADQLGNIVVQVEEWLQVQ